MFRGLIFLTFQSDFGIKVHQYKYGTFENLGPENVILVFKKAHSVSVFCFSSRGRTIVLKCFLTKDAKRDVSRYRLEMSWL